MRVRKPAGDQEVPAQRWVDISADDHGVSVLNDGRYGHDGKDGVIGMTLLRSTTSPDPVADLGQHAVTYALWPHEGAWEPHQTVRRGAELNAPLMTRAAQPHTGKRTLISLLQVDVPNAIVSAVKQAYDGRGWIIRVWETSGNATPVTLTFDHPIAEAHETDLLEDRIADVRVKGAAVTFNLTPHEIKTLFIGHER